MGSLILPSSGLIYTDAQIAIYTVERFPTYAPLLTPLWMGAQAGNFTVVSSELTLLETLVVPLRIADAMLVNDFENLWQRANTRLLPITESILREAARLRATLPALKTPEALHAATALLHSCALFVTNDAAFKRVPGLSVTLLDEVLAAP
ncbi:MAG TPA: PIN domain-containing protein [Chthonomonadaceae bacterium]|nr:PIN domain-containing protein [Chthonomonadaceae bacterium]